MSDSIDATEGAAASQPASGGGSRLVVPLLVVAALVTAIIVLPVNEWLSAGVDWVDGLGWWGPVALVGLYIVACVLLIPGSVLTLGAGAAFGVVKGALAVSVGATLGAAAAFLVGRYVARGWVKGKVAGNERFAAVDSAVGREGFKIVFLTRLSPVFPFNILNYAYGLTAVSFRNYVLASWIGMIPGTIMYVYLGSAAKDVVAAEEGASTGETVLKIVGLVATIVVTVYVTRIARKALDKEVAQ
jgi:uncharacterized membrane protein YdjX (TVP38/TMEM64 family)